MTNARPAIQQDAQRFIVELLGEAVLKKSFFAHSGDGSSSYLQDA